MTREQRTVFGEVAEQYDAIRPSYPNEMFEIVMAYGSLREGDRALEIGAGTGIATLPFMARGLDVHALEPSAGMAEVLRTKGVRVDETTFEQFDVNAGEFSLVFAAQAWHWVAAEDRCSMVADALRPGGTVALLWNIGRDHPEPFKTDNDAAYERWWPQQDLSYAQVEAADIIDEFARCGAFEPVIERRVTWHCSYSRDEWLRMLGTASNHRMLPEDVRTALHAEVGDAIDAHGGALPVTYDTVCYLSRRV